MSILLDRYSAVSLQEQIFREFVRLIERRLLLPGEALVSIREFSETYAVSKNTVILAFQRLSDEGWIETRPGTLARVSHHVPKISRYKFVDHQELTGAHRDSNNQNRLGIVRQPAARSEISRMDPSMIDFRLGAVSAHVVYSQVLKKYADKISNFSALYSYQNPEGTKSLRASIACHLLKNKGVEISDNQVVIVNGAQEGLSILAYLFCKEGRHVWMENPCYRGAYNIFHSYHARIHLQDVDDEGMALTGMSQQQGLVHITPEHQYPLGIRMSTARRANISEWARSTGSLIIENDYDGDFLYEYELRDSLMLMAPMETVYLGSFSKALGPGFRLGYMVCPSWLVRDVINAKSLLSAATAGWEQGIVAELMSSGRFDAYLRYMRKFCLTRRNALIKALAEFGGAVTGTGGASHLCWRLSESAPSAIYIKDKLAELGTRVYGLNDISLHQDHFFADRMIFLGYGSVSMDNIIKLHADLSRVLGMDFHRKS
ncbi:MAG: PLP-dependent aminotransferase family protein [Proteobacteria bacterium]|nr:PLP-dependent aminotransferase family protein [Pseudomonadota bacterium]